MAPIALAILQWGDEQLQRRRRLVQRLELHAHGHMQSVAENLMPPSVVLELRHARFGCTPGGCSVRSCVSPYVSRPCVWHTYSMLTVLQADLVGFTAFARNKAPEEVVYFINTLFRLFDECIERRKIYKMETIGDAYVCVSGMPDNNDGVHDASAMLALALDLRRATAGYNVSCHPPIDLGLRIGVHSGECVGGVVGSTMQRYHLFGDTMRIAEVLESTAPTNGVHLSETTRAQALAQDPNCLSLADATGQKFRIAERPCRDGQLLTSKGEAVPHEAIDKLATFLLEVDSEKPVGV
eukprot:gnl/TRDRNA2_/TRDRNA2_149128_c4_seq1.p1 gnl/TRDRNA2_/TRDRNA2_149128_c4~~gnl/TRDRNA2_/TRDRNA2_149128_c4_seq1.p1  ORF type:complete len:306 (-),score=44.71 gnl/TRDRNA2_/TRDRNA2_149128_c4_seq1:300-1187(-)